MPSPLVFSWSPLLLIGFRLKKCVCPALFEVLNCWLNLVASCLDDENEILLKIIISFSAVHFALPSIPSIVAKICLLVRGLNKISKFLPFMSTDVFLDVFIKCWQFRHGWVSFVGVVSPGHHIQFLCWYRFLTESLASSMDVV